MELHHRAQSVKLFLRLRLKPSRASVEALIEKIPCGIVMTTQFLRNALAESHNAQVTCPFLTKRALMAIAEDPETKAPFWRVVTAKWRDDRFLPERRRSTSETPEERGRRDRG
jgi:hypothetical protein